MIAGLSYLADIVDPAEELALLAAIDDGPWLGDLRRRVQHFGYRYDYKARQVDRGMYLGPLPPWVASIVERMRATGAIAMAPDQLIINEYEPGQGITPHIDCVPCFGPEVASLSLGSTCVMELSRPATDEVVPVWLARRSLIVLRDDARFQWRHAIKGRRSDPHEGGRQPRGRRVSLTFRTVRLVDASP